MPIKNILTSQADALFTILQADDWSTVNFDWKSGDTYAELYLRDSPFFFRIYLNGIIGFSPGKDSIEVHEMAAAWESKESFFKFWLSYLKREISAPNFWNSLPSDTQLIDSVFENDENSAFTDEERKSISSGVEELKNYLAKNVKLDLEPIKGQIDYLVESSNRLGRKDWSAILVSTLFGLALNNALRPEVIQSLFQFAWTLFHAVLVHKVYLPQ